MLDYLVFQSVSKQYGAVTAINDVSFSVEQGEILSVVGPSGSGKTTILGVCAGVVAPSAGKVLVNGQNITDLAIEQRNVGVVFQSYALFPHLSVAENVGFSLKTRQHRTDAAEARRRVASMLKLVGLSGFEKRMPRQLSGGQQQRVALARALVYRPSLLLLDEPLGAIDPSLKNQLQEDILRLRDQLGVTVLYVTHDQQEAMNVSDRIAVLRHGRLEQISTARDLYHQPVTAFVATFFGDANLLSGRVTSVDGGIATIDTGAGRFRALRGVACLGEDVLLVVRPESIRVDRADDGGADASNRTSGSVARLTFLGAMTRLVVSIAPGIDLRVDRPSADAGGLLAGQQVSLAWSETETRVVNDTPRLAVVSDEFNKSRSVLPVGTQINQEAR